MKKHINRIGYRLNGYTIIRKQDGAKIGHHWKWYAVHDACGVHLKNPITIKSLSTKICPNCQKSDHQRRILETKWKNRQMEVAKEEQTMEAIDSAYRFFVSMPTHEFNNRWNDA